MDVDAVALFEEGDGMHQNPYAADLGERDPLQALEETPLRIRRIVQNWTAGAFERSYAPGKWTARQLLVHLAQTELALTTRARYALGREGYAAQSFSQDDWIGIDHALDARTALGAYLALRAMNLALFRSLSPAQRERSFTHPEYGTLNVWWIASQLAGHDIHHAEQIERIQ
ncbi:MAG TPA: DinB family protein [Vicinamibacterales bacterium]|nr:DinB family protein [Vicinamibacterales bacterium]